MIAWLKRTIAWAVAGAELAELERWRVEWTETWRWLCEFADAKDALDHLERIAKGRQQDDLLALRERMRTRRDARPGPLTAVLTAPRTMTPAEIDAWERAWRATPMRPGTLKPLEAVAKQAIDATLADVGLGDCEFQQEPRRVAYKFLSPGCESRS